MRSARSGADDRYIGRRREERGEGVARVQSASNRPCGAWRACTPTISTTSLAGPESWPMLMVIWLGGGTIQLALGLAREAQPAERGCGS
jgi:hypothetical protein